MSETMTAAEVKDALRRRHQIHVGTGEWVCISEAFSGFSTMGGGVDLLALGVWKMAKVSGLLNVRTVHNPIVAYEVKVSRSDFRRELYGYRPGPDARYRHRIVPAWPGKQTFAMMVADYFMFAVPRGLLKKDEIARRVAPEDGGLYLPVGCGLVEVGDGGCRVTVNADRIEGDRWTLDRHQVAELIRHATDPARERTARLMGVA